MQRYYWPNYEMQLLGELQKQQNAAQFCDTLLQTEGISVPTHSCILAALSPYFSRRLSSSPSPPSGQKHLLQLHTVTAHVLLKLVGLMYSGELEVEGNKEKSELFAAAGRLGFSDLVESCKDRARWQSTQSYTKTYRSLSMQDAQVQVKMAVNNRNSPEKKSCASVGTQTVVLLDKETSPVPFVVGFSALAQCENMPVDKLMCLTPCPTITSDGESDAGPSTNHKQSSALSCEADAYIESSQRSQGEGCSQPSLEDEDFQGLGRRDGATRCKVTEYEEQVSKDQMLEEKNKEGRRSIRKAGVKNLAKMKQVMSPTEISIKVKLRRTPTAEVWEVARVQDKDETVSLVSSVRQVDAIIQLGCSTQKTQVKDSHNPSCSADPKAGNPQALVASSPVNASDSYLFPVGDLNVSHSRELESELEVDEPQGQEETDEQIDMLLEDIMKGMNILPYLDGDCKRLQAGHDRESDLHQTAGSDLRQSPMYRASSPAESAVHQDLEVERGGPAAHTDLHCCARSWSGLTNTSAVQPSVPMQQNALISLSARSLGQMDPLKCQGMLVSKHQCPAEPTLPLACTSGLKHEQASGKNNTTLGFLPQHEDGHSDSLFSSPWMNDMRLPPCLSPVEFSTPKEMYPNLPSDPRNDEKQAQSLRRQLPWLAESPQSLQFPFSTIIKNSNISLCKNKNGGSEFFQQYLNQKIIDPRKLSGSVKSLDPGRAGTLKRKCDYKGNEVIRKKRRRRRRQVELLQDFSTSFFTPINIKVTDETNALRDIKKETTSKSAEQTWIRTRGFVKRYLQRACSTVPEMSYTGAGLCSEKVKKLAISLPKRKVGRPPKIKVEQNPFVKILAAPKDKHDKMVEEDRPKKEISSKRTSKKRGTSKSPWMNTLKDFQKLVQQRHLKTKTVKDSQEPAKPSRNSEGEDGGKEGSAGYNSATKTRTDTKETSEAHNQEPSRADYDNQPCDTSAAHSNKTDHDDDKISKMSHFCGDESNPVSAQDRLNEETMDVSPNREQRNTDEGLICCSGDVKSDQSVPSDGGASFCSCLQSNVSVNARPQTPEKTEPLVTGGDQTEEEEEEEIDVLLYCPEKVADQRAVLSSLVMTVDEEEEDEKEIDVIGDEL